MPTMADNTTSIDQTKIFNEKLNGRLAMLGLMGFLSEAVTPGSVPGLKGLVQGYDGNVMAPFAPGFTFADFGANLAP